MALAGLGKADSFCPSAGMFSSPITNASLFQCWVHQPSLVEPKQPFTPVLTVYLALVELGYDPNFPVTGTPLLHHGDWPVSDVRGHDAKVLSRRNMSPSFEDTEYKKPCMPSFSGLKGRYIKREASFTYKLKIYY